MALDFTLVLRAETGAAKAQLEGVATGVKGVTTATTDLTTKSRAAATAADGEAGAKRRSAQAARELEAANSRASAATGNLVANFNDVGMMLMAGQNPLQLAIQQGSQITQVLGPMGAAGAAKALGGAFTNLLNPINLIIPAVIAAAGYTIQWLTGAEEGAKSLEDQIKAVTDAVATWRDESGKSLADLRKDFGTITPELVAMQRELNQLRIADVMKEAQQAAQGLSETMNGGLFGQAANIKDLLGLEEFSRQGNVGNAVVQEIQGLLSAVGNASGVREQLAAVEQLRTRFAEVTGGVTAMNAEQRVFYQSVLESEAALRMAAVATGEVASGTEDAGRAANELANRAQNVVRSLASADGSRLVAAFQAAFPAASQLLGIARGIVATIGGLQVPAPGPGMGRGSSPGGPLVGSADLAALQAGGGVWRTMPVKLPKIGGGGGGGGGGAAARDEANALQELISSLEAEIEALHVQDPIQQEMLKHREALAGATAAEKKKVEELIAAREREQMLMEAAKARAQFFEEIGTNAIEALIVKGESFNDVLKNIARSLIEAALQATIFGKGPFGSLFGGTSILSGLFGGGGGGGGGLGSLLGGGDLFGGLAGGGMVHGPGTGTSDSIPTMLSNGEYVVNARATARNRHMLEAINSGGRIGGFAEGGYVGTDSRRMGSRSGGRDLPATIYMDLRGVKGDREIEAVARKSAAQMIALYDKEGLPVSVKRVSGDPRRTG